MTCLRCLLFSFVVLLTVAGCADHRAHVDGEQNEPSPLNTNYALDGQELPVHLVNGRSEVLAAPDSTTVVRTTVWGEPTMGDLSGDGRDDAALILIQDPGGSGTFYYLAAAIREGERYRGIGGVLLGDRIQPQRITVEGNRIRVDYLGRAGGEAMATIPSHARKRTFVYDQSSQHLAIVADDFEGEADPSRMRLPMKTWVWQRTQYNNDTVETPITADAFTIKFTEDQRVVITTDCNNLQGRYETDGNRLRFTMLAGTLMHCEGAQETLFARALEKVNGYLFTGRGELVLELKYDTGSMIFR